MAAVPGVRAADAEPGGVGAEPRPAVARARPHPGGGLRAHHPRGRAGDPRRGPHPHLPRLRAAGAPGDRTARAARRAGPARHPHRRGGRAGHDGRRAHRDDVRAARRRQAHRRVGQLGRPAGRGRRDRPRGDGRRPRQHRRRPAARGGRPAGEAGVSAVLRVRDLRVSYGGFEAVKGVSFDLEPGRALGVVGESGSGKTTLAASLLRLTEGADVTGEITVAGTDVLTAPEPELRRLRGGRIAMVFQDPLSSLDPYLRVGDQIAEVYRVHTGASRKAARAKAVEVLDRVGVPDAERRARAHPHEFSGGMRQRALIAMALALEPRVLVADEPTTALDVTVQAQILALLNDLRAETGMALLLVSHDFGVIAGSADEVLVLHEGEAVEHGPVGEVLREPKAPYTRELLAAVPRIDAPRPSRPSRRGEPLLRVTDLRRDFVSGPPLRRRTIPAVDGVTFDVRRGETLGVVGESGSGKSTLARLVVRLLEPTSGRIEFDGHDLSGMPERRLRRLRRDLQMVFQDPGSSLNPRRPVGESVADPLRVQGEPAPAKAARALLARVGLDPARYDDHPHEFSGGQRQRIGIARALALRPRLLVCDEPVTALDVSTQAAILTLLADLQDELDLTLIFVSHDLAVVRQVSDRVAVMRDGRIVELADTDTVFDSPAHAYTRSLLKAVPVLDPAAVRGP
ncbi:ABC transporter ATP-binding protein [Actinomadura decatromicini]|uniref:ABC transporter ATP-binding protein n=1 Tax=Actinomadura decatromicini TaxID=2604572 RepID=A0A5D3FWK5_9ACTN|nr:ABC transporter ATP-binding protein [Actinomadura decatromicini]